MPTPPEYELQHRAQKQRNSQQGENRVDAVGGRRDRGGFFRESRANHESYRGGEHHASAPPYYPQQKFPNSYNVNTGTGWRGAMLVVDAWSTVDGRIFGGYNPALSTYCRHSNYLGGFEEPYYYHQSSTSSNHSSQVPPAAAHSLPRTGTNDRPGRSDFKRHSDSQSIGYSTMSTRQRYA